MAQGRQQRSAAWSHYAQPAAVQSTTVVNARVACEQLEQMSRKLAAARAEISRYQTRLFACERQMLALRKENAALEAACEQAREEAQRSAEEAEKLRAALRLDDDVPAVLPEPQPEEEPVAEAAASEPVPETEAQPEAPEQPAPAQETAPQAPAEPEWKPETELEHLSVELMNWFDEMMGA